jgi:universal stress protein E
MSGFDNILVGVDLRKCKPHEAATLDLVAENAVRRALWVARASAARLTFLSALAHHGRAAQRPWHLPGLGAADQPSCLGTVEESARNTLTSLVREARDQGIEAGAVLAAGQAWVEIVRQVLRDKHDLLVVGTHDPHGLRRLLLGSTARKLLHECPCPVWVSKPGPEAVPHSILVASDLSPLSDAAVRLGLTLGRLAGAQTHILDVVEYRLDRLWSTSLADPSTSKYHSRVRAEAEQALHAQVERSGHASERTVTVHTAEGEGMPDHAVLKFIHDYHIDLLVLGTVARHGLAGALLGNTAERLLPAVSCSLLAVKPADFDCSVQTEGS